MKNYNPNYMWGTHTVKITLQQWNYKGELIVEIGGNCKGFSILESSKDSINKEETYNSNCKFQIEDNWFYCILKAEDGDELDVEDELDNLEDYIVKIEIIDFKESEVK